MEETTAITISTVLTEVGNVVSSGIEWIGDYLTVITSNPVLLLFVIVPFVGLGIGLLRRLMRVS